MTSLVMRDISLCHTQCVSQDRLGNVKSVSDVLNGVHGTNISWTGEQCQQLD